MRAALALFVLVFASQATALAGRTGQARSAEVLTKRTKASPRGAKEWGGISAAYVSNGRKEARTKIRRAKPGDENLWRALGESSGTAKISDVIGKHLGLTPGQIASKERRHDRAIKKQLRRMIRQVRSARASGTTIQQAFPGSMVRDYVELEGKLNHEIAKIDERQVDHRRTQHDAN